MYYTYAFIHIYIYIHTRRETTVPAICPMHASTARDAVLEASHIEYVCICIYIYIHT